MANAGCTAAVARGSALFRRPSEASVRLRTRCEDGPRLNASSPIIDLLLLRGIQPLSRRNSTNTQKALQMPRRQTENGRGFAPATALAR